MLKLRKVELLGFKSFCEKTQITFSGSGITCIVGPNGCGKSNIADAISWVLGEQSHKSLRAERMADCIFNGTQKRPPMGLAEVSLTLVDPELAEAAAFVLGEENEAEETEATDGNPASEQTPVEAPPDVPGDEPEPVGAGVNWPGTTPFGRNVPGDEPEPVGAGLAPPGNTTDPAPHRRKRAPGPAPLTKPGEIVIGRRLYRSGQSEYVINGRVARLRDIQEIFMGTGLGPDSYAIIEQGRIGQILSSKPMDRRAVLEEAAGVTKYKTKRRLAEAKLESSKLNLARVNDILVEVEKQLASLKRQASRARRYTEIREQMRGLLRQTLASKAAELDAEAERLAQLLRQIAASETLQTQALTALETEQESLGARSYELESEIRRSHNLLGQCALELDRAENRIGFNHERLRELEARARQFLAEISQAGHQAAQIEERARAHQRSVTALGEEKAGRESALEKLATLAQERAATQQATEAQIEDLRQLAGQLGDELTRLHGEHAQAEQARAHHAEALARVEQVERQLESECAQHCDRARDAEAGWQAADARANDLAHALRDAQARIAALRCDQQETTQRADRTREELSGARARRATLEKILHDRAYTAEAVQKLFAANGGGPAGRDAFRAVGVLADYAEVAEQYESAVEQFLRDELEYVVVETFDHARAGIALLREEVGGRATFFVDSLRHLQVSPSEPPVPFHAEAGLVSRLDKLVEFRGPLGAAAKQFLPKLQSAFLVETAALAERLARDNPAYHFLIPDGTCYHGRLVSGGRPGEAGPLAMKRELRSLESQIARLEYAAEEAQAALRWLEDELREQSRALEETAAQRLEAEKALVTAAHVRDQAGAERARAEHQLAECRSDLARLSAEAGAARARAERARQRQAEASESRTTAQAEMSQAIGQVAGLREEIRAQHDELAGRRAELAGLAERLANAEGLAQRLAEELLQVRDREAGLREQQAEVARERGEVEVGTADQQRRAESLQAEKARLEERRTQLEQEYEAARVRTVEVDDALRLARQKLGDLREQRAQYEIERARNDSDCNHLRETCLAELNAQPEDLIALELALLGGEELAAAETSYREMKARIEALGPVNMMALEEYQECDQRFTFLSRERDDLVKSIEDTQQTIRELDEVSRQKFQQAFEAVNRNFADVFRTLFGGGTGEMRLTEPDSSGDTGIDIVAQPPGKRLQNVLLLSGGEKALTALALLIAIFRYQPSPFCILDEVDAPLDEANVGRFASLITQMSQQTQFIIVTHNRRTMEMAPVLYGVTMQEPGVSKLVSVRWDEPQPASGANPASTPNATAA